MNNVINKYLLTGEKFMPEMHLRQLQFVYSACGPFTRHKKRIKKFKQTGDTRYIYRNELDKACFQHDSAYADHKDLINRTKSHKVLRDKAYDIASNPEYDSYQRGLPSMVCRDTTFTIQNALFGAMQITKNATDSSKNNYKGYGICFDERSEFNHTITEGDFAHTTDATNVLIFGADMSFSVHKTNKANHIYLMGTGLTQGINDTTIYAEKNFYRNFTDPVKNLY